MEQQHAVTLVTEFKVSAGFGRARQATLWRCQQCQEHPYQLRDHLGAIVRFGDAAYGRQIAGWAKLPKGG